MYVNNRHHNKCIQQHGVMNAQTQTATFIYHTVAIDQQQAVQYMVNTDKFNKHLPNSNTTHSLGIPELHIWPICTQSCNCLTLMNCMQMGEIAISIMC